jgi:hypothetical protein
MILVRDIFRLKFGKAKEAKALWKEMRGVLAKLGASPSRMCMDLTGPFYTLVMEGTYDSLAAYEKLSQQVLGHPEFAKAYGPFTALVESGAREIYTVVE